MGMKPPVIRASGGRSDFTRLRHGRRGHCPFYVGACAMTAAVLEKTASAEAVETNGVRALILVRVASALRGIERADLATDLAAVVAHRLSAGRYRTLLDRELAGLAAARLVKVGAVRMEATDRGVTHAAAFLGLKGGLPRLWSDLRDVRLVARALGLQREPPKRIKALCTPEGLRAEIVQRAFDLPIKGIATPARLRTGLAAVALERAFGNKIKTERAGKTGLSARAGRLLAAQLSRQPRDFGTDARLVAALAAECVGATRSDLGALRLGVLRQFVERGREAPGATGGMGAVAPPAHAHSAAASAPARVPSPRLPGGRPDLAGFAAEVRRRAANHALGWPGNRKAYISHVWRHLSEQRTDWGLSEIEFKCMLAEAHRAGHVVLANADLKDNKNIKDLQDSAVVYKNAVFHFIRVDV
jgi:hypothetical protein